MTSKTTDIPFTQKEIVDILIKYVYTEYGMNADAADVQTDGDGGLIVKAKLISKTEKSNSGMNYR